MDALRTDDLTSSLAPFLAVSLVIHVLLVFLLPMASIEAPERPAPPPVTPATEPGAGDLTARGFLAPLGSLRMQVLELAVPLSAPAARVAARSRPETAPGEVEVVQSPVVQFPAVAREAPRPEAASTSRDVPDGAAAGEEPGAPEGSGTGGGESAGEAGGSGSGTGEGTGVGPGVVTPPVIVAMVWPEFPKAAKKQLKVPIVLAVHVTAEGGVDQVEVETPSGCASCEAAAIASAWQLRFQPATRDGAPISMWTRFPVVFGQR